MLRVLFGGKTTKSLAALCVLSFALNVTVADNACSQAAIVAPQRGMCYVTWEKERFASQYSDASLQRMTELGVDHISICVTQYQEKYNSTSIMATDRTPSDKSLSHVIRRAHKLGMTVMLKPHIDLIDKYDGTYWRADIGHNNDENWAKWFSEYRRVILHYAKLAKKNNVAIFCVGTELAFTTQKPDEWRKVIQEVRDVFPGKLVYAANWDNFRNIEFWEELDYVGIDAYFPLVYDPDPSVDDIKKGWEKWKNEISSWQKNIGKPVLFTEIGYPSSPHAPHSPWQGGMEGNADVEIQARCYEAFFETVWQEDWFAGVYWWKWNPNTRSGGMNNRQFTPQNKPAESIIEANYKNNRKMHNRLACAK
jgi:hypothetical protein